VRVQRGGKLNSKSFKKTPEDLQKAIEWRDRLLTTVGKSAKYPYRIKANKGKSSGLPVGVSRTEYWKERMECVVVEYLVSIISDSKQENIHFWLGDAALISADTEEHAMLSAIACREDYEYCLDRGMPFGREKYRGWRSSHLFDIPTEKLALIP
jgi:hypothetical protein